MPRISTRASQASGSSEAPLVLSGDEDGVAPSPRIPPEEKERLRQMQKACTLRMYDHAVAYFMRTLQRTKTEGVGDCWLLSIMGGFEVKDPNRRDYSSTPEGPTRRLRAQSEIRSKLRKTQQILLLSQRCFSLV